MKFLITVKNKDAFFALPDQRRAELIMESWAMIEKYQKAGKLKEVLYTSDLKGAVMTWDITTSEEAVQITLENPLWALEDIKIEPMVDANDAKKAVEAMWKSKKK